MKVMESVLLLFCFNIICCYFPGLPFFLLLWWTSCHLYRKVDANNTNFSYFIFLHQWLHLLVAPDDFIVSLFSAVASLKKKWRLCSCLLYSHVWPCPWAINELRSVHVTWSTYLALTVRKKPVQVQNGTVMEMLAKQNEQGSLFKKSLRKLA